MSEGTGLSASWLLLILAASLLLFLFWDGPLWSVPDGTSHFGRIALSYAIVMPLAAAALALAKAFTWARLLTTSGLLWAIKLIVTSLLFVILASGTAQHYQPAVATETKLNSEKARRYSPAATLEKPSVIRGKAFDHGRPLVDTLVALEHPTAGRPLSPPAVLELVIAGSKYQSSVFAGTVRDALRVHNRDTELHTLSWRQNGALRVHIPIPPLTGEQRIELPRDPGTYALACENHPTERALFVVFDHPYFTRTQSDGAFELIDVAPGSTSVSIHLFGAEPRKFDISSSGGADALVLELSEDRQR